MRILNGKEIILDKKLIVEMTVEEFLIIIGAVGSTNNADIAGSIRRYLRNNVDREDLEDKINLNNPNDKVLDLYYDLQSQLKKYIEKV